jgi:hypothetical protein
MHTAASALRGAGLGLVAALAIAAPVTASGAGAAIAVPGAVHRQADNAVHRQAAGAVHRQADNVDPNPQASPAPQVNPSGEPSPIDTPSAPASPTAGQSTAPTDPSPAPEPPAGSATGPAAGRRVGIVVTADSATLTDRYWTGQTAMALRVTARNVGNVAETVTFRVSPPAGVTVLSCGGGCAVSLAPAESKSITVELRAAPDAWKRAPLTGTVTATAAATGAATKVGQTAWDVIFPPGPPAPGLRLQVSDVRLDPDPSAPAILRLLLTNGSAAPGTAAVTVVAPAGVSLGTLPRGCQRLKPTTAECLAGTVGAGRRWELRVPLAVPDRLRSEAPLAGLVQAQLHPTGQGILRTQASYQIFAADGQAGVTVGTDTDPDASGTRLHLHDRAARSPLTQPVVVWPIIGGSVLLLIVVTIGLAMVLRRRAEEVAQFAADPAEAAAEPEPGAGPARADATAVISAGPVDRTPTPRGPIAWEWTTGEEPVQRPEGAGDDPDADPHAGANGYEPEGGYEPEDEYEDDPYALDEGAAGGGAQPGEAPGTGAPDQESPPVHRERAQPAGAGTGSHED